VIFVIATVVILAKSHPGFQPSAPPFFGGKVGGFLLTTGAVFGYAAGWNPYAADYTRYFQPNVSKAAIALWSGLGVFLSCVVLEFAGAASATLASNPHDTPTAAFTSHLPTALADLTLLAIAVGAVCANVLNVYSGAMSFVAMGVKLPLALRRAIVAVVAGVIGYIVALTGLNDAGARYENFLLVIAYWIAPWLAVYFCDQFLHRKRDVALTEAMLFDKRHTNWAGPVAMAVGMGLSIWLFSNQTEYVGLVPTHVPAFGDITFEVGFVITAVVYLTWHAVTGRAGSRAPAAVTSGR
jgi:purine-cytosine permease-like protein